MRAKDKANEALNRYDGCLVFTSSGLKYEKKLTQQERIKYAKSDINFIINDYDKEVESYRISNYPGTKKLNWLEEQTKRIYPKSFWLEVLKEL